MTTQEIDLDLAARRVIMSAMLYYGLGKPILSDGEFDELCGRLVTEWNDLSEQRKLCLGSPEELLAGGYHIKITTIAEDGAISWLESAGLYDPDSSERPVYTSEPRYLEGIGRWRNAGDYTWITEPSPGNKRTAPKLCLDDPMTVWLIAG